MMFKKFERGRICDRLVLLTVVLLTASFAAFAQSTDQNLPTPVTTSEIRGEIRARDIGDPRLTTYYYVFRGDRGDIFINIVTTNLNGDIDIFTAEGLRPQTKITIYADDAIYETGRVIYLRKPEKLILRIQGRTPNDDPATFQIKFAGSFEPVEGLAETDAPALPEVKNAGQGAVRVNSVGTIIEEEPKPPVDTEEAPETETVAEATTDPPEDETPVPDEEPSPVAAGSTESENDKKDSEEEVAATLTVKETDPQPPVGKENEIPPVFDPTKKPDDIIREAGRENRRPRVLITDLFDPSKKPSEEKPAEPAPTEVTVEIGEKPKDTSAVVTIEIAPEEDEPAERTAGAEKPEEEKTDAAPDPLASIFLKVELRDGRTLEWPMTQVLSMNVIKGVLTIVTSDGRIVEYSILEVVRMTIE